MHSRVALFVRIDVGVGEEQAISELRCELNLRKRAKIACRHAFVCCDCPRRWYITSGKQ